jgi:hypothetical protein
MRTARTLRLARPDVSHGPFHYFEAVPWLLLAAACRYAAVNLGTLAALLAFIAESIAVLMAFNAVAKRAFPLFDRPIPLEGTRIDEEYRLALRMFWRLFVVLLVSSTLVGQLGFRSEAPSFVHGLVGVAFNQLSFPGRAWTAVIAALMLLLLLDADRVCKPTLAAALRGLAGQGLRFCAAISALAVFYIGWGTIQILLFNAIWSTPLGGADPRTKGVIFFTVTFIFAFARLWATVLILTWGLKPYGIRDQAAAAAASSNRP